MVSPYLRTRQTAEIALADARHPDWSLDERLRDRELGVLDLLTAHGVQARLPDEAVRRSRLGKFYYRPPGGESWADVAAAAARLLGDLRRDHAGGRVLLFGHEAIVLLLRYLVEGLDRGGADGRRATTARSRTARSARWRARRRRAAPELFNDVDHLHREGAPPTRRRTSMPNRSEPERVITPQLLRDWPLPVPQGGKDVPRHRAGGRRLPVHPGRGAARRRRRAARRRRSCCSSRSPSRPPRR